MSTLIRPILLYAPTHLFFLRPGPRVRRIEDIRCLAPFALLRKTGGTTEKASTDAHPTPPCPPIQRLLVHSAGKRCAEAIEMRQATAVAERAFLQPHP